MSGRTSAHHHTPHHKAADPALRHVLTHLLTPLLMCLGMGLAYMGAFVQPEPHHLPVAVVGEGPRAMVFAQTVQNDAGAALDVRTLTRRADAVDEVEDRRIAAAYVPSDTAPELIVATAASDTSATVAEKIFTPVAARQGAPLKVTDVVPTAGHDPTGQGLFFLLVAVSIGSYASVAVLGGAGAALRMRGRALLVVGVSGVVSAIGALLAGPVFHLAHHHLAGVWGLSWLYSAGILFIGVGLHTFLKRWTTLTMMVLFVMLNFTSSGGLFRPELQNGFFGSLHAFWNGAGYVDGLRGLLYFGSDGLCRQVGTLAVWLFLGLVLTTAAGLFERRRATGEAGALARPTGRCGAEKDDREWEQGSEKETEEEMGEAVGV
ncbi:hypothetical protein ABZ934_23410 [Streptomyces sp. NPDC046557]|uniref:hypothetical protein n=1 Tax=Streptomyces sp. NPDC046557 TaxID=3155372 RepID=UPI0033E5E217